MFLHLLFETEHRNGRERRSNVPWSPSALFWSPGAVLFSAPSLQLDSATFCACRSTAAFPDCTQCVFLSVWASFCSPAAKLLLDSRENEWKIDCSSYFAFLSVLLFFPRFFSLPLPTVSSLSVCSCSFFSVCLSCYLHCNERILLTLGVQSVSLFRNWRWFFLNKRGTRFMVHFFFFCSRISLYVTKSFYSISVESQVFNSRFHSSDFSSSASTMYKIHTGEVILLSRFLLSPFGYLNHVCAIVWHPCLNRIFHICRLNQEELLTR